jgi:hypothetical protein
MHKKREVFRGFLEIRDFFRQDKVSGRKKGSEEGVLWFAGEEIVDGGRRNGQGRS